MSAGEPSAQMRVAVLAAETSWRLERVPVPAPGEGEVRLRVEGCGLCGSDLPVWEGRPWFRYPRDPGAPGHETWGVIDAVGSGVAGLAPGRRVAALSYRGYADYDLAGADRVVALPEALAEMPFPGEALGCACNVMERSGVAAGASVAVVGTGFLGLLLVQLSTRAGAEVLAVARRAEVRELALRLGAAHAVEPETAARIVEELTGGRMCDVVLEAAGAQDTLDLAGELTRVGGRLVIAGYHQDGRRTVDMQSWNWKGLDVICAHERDPETYLRGIERAVRAVAEGQLDPRPLYTHRFSLERVQEAFETASARPAGYVKGLVCP